MNKEEYQESFGRLIEPNEIVFDCDNKEGFGDLANNQIGMLLSADGYTFPVWKVEGGKSTHIHILIPHLEELDPEQLKRYKESFLRKYINKLRKIIGDKKYLEDFDFKLCGKHRIASPGKIHYKYNKPKLLLAVVNKGLTNFCDKGLFEECKNFKQKERNPINGESFNSLINKEISLIELFRKYGFEVKGNKAVCRFHNDTNPSISIDDDKGLWYCHGCCKGGDIIKFLTYCKMGGFVKNG